MKITSLIAIMVIVSSCASTSVTRPTTSQYAPKGYRPKGMVKYLNRGADFVIGQRKEDAFKQMSETCNGNYKITSEGPEESNSNYWQFAYECEKNKDGV